MDVATSPRPYNVTFEVTPVPGQPATPFVVEVHPEWAPIAAARFKDLVDADFFHNMRFWRVNSGSAQFGISGIPKLQRNWHYAKIKDEPATHANDRGTLAFNFDTREWFRANSRTTDMFINTDGSGSLRARPLDDGYVPFARVVGDGMARVVDWLTRTDKAEPDASRIEHEGTRYLKTEFPQLSVLNSVKYSYSV